MKGHLVLDALAMAEPALGADLRLVRMPATLTFKLWNAR